MNNDSKPNVKSVFSSITDDWYGEKNNYDCYYLQIPDSVKNIIRQKFGIGFNEDIIFVRDTSFFNNRDQGLVITDAAIYCIPDNYNPEEKLYLPWDILKNVVYKDMILYFFGYGGEDDKCPIHITFFTKSNEEAIQTKVGHQLAPLLTKVCNLFTPPKNPIEEIVEKCDQLKADGKENEVLELLLDSYKKMEKDNYELYFLISQAYRNRKDYQQALKYCDLYLANLETSSSSYVYGMYLKESIYALDLKDFAQSRKYAFLTAKYATTEKRDDGVLIKDDAKNDFDIYEEHYVKEFITQPYNDRKILMPVREYVDLSQNHISVVNIKNMPDIHFPIGHPKANQLYIGHPYLPQIYLPFENYQLELIEDKVREFCLIAQCLGATEISIDAENAMQSSTSQDISQSLEGLFDSLVSAEGTSKRNRKNNLIEEISQAINLHQKFSPTKKPFLPENTVWYQYEPSWQRLYNQRVSGCITQHEERIETRKSQMVDNHELQEVKTELQNLFTEANISWNTSMDEKFSKQENAVLSIKVTFAPINSLGNDTERTPLFTSSTPSFTSAELEYIENIKEFLEEDAEITPRERRMFDRIRTKLGISEERAKELEDSLLKQQLTEDEEEYLEMYREYMEKGEITDKERRRLDKFASALGIEEDRIKEIESIN